MKGLKLIFLGLVVSVLFMGQAMAGVPAVTQWAWSGNLSVDQSSLNLAPGNSATVNFLLDNIMATPTMNSCSDGDCNAMVSVMDSLSGDNVTGNILNAAAGTWSPISWQSTIGPFASPGMMTIFNTATFVNSQNAGTSNQVMIDVNVASVPEPSTMLLLGGGLLSLVFFRRKFRK